MLSIPILVKLVYPASVWAACTKKDVDIQAELKRYYLGIICVFFHVAISVSK